MLKANFYSTLFYSISFPYIGKLLISNIDYKFISANSLIICIAVIIVSALWQKHESFLFKQYNKFLYLEIVFYAFLLLFLYFNYINYVMYYMIETILFSVITKNIIMGGSILRQLYFDDLEDRKKYDIQSQMTVSIASIIGYTLSIIFNISLEFALIFCFIGIFVDNLFFIDIYKDNYYKYKEGGK